MRTVAEASVHRCIVIALSSSAETDASQTPPSACPGVLVAIGSHKLHIRCGWVP